MPFMGLKYQNVRISQRLTNLLHSFLETLRTGVMCDRKKWEHSKGTSNLANVSVTPVTIKLVS